jgi:2-C-methyl-D-erythritol 4-phosphate cytidylyltransferase
VSADGIPHEDVAALVLAAGEGDRLGGKPKALLAAGGKTLLEHAVALVAPFAAQVIVGVRPADVATATALLGDSATVVPGGATRHETFGTILAEASRPLILLHEVARPLATPELFARVLAAAREFGAACPCVPVSRRDAVAITDGDFFGEGVPLDRVVRTQIPQAFTREILIDALRKAQENGWENASSVPPLCVRAGYRVRMIAGERENLKITFSEDWDLARARLGD